MPLLTWTIAYQTGSAIVTARASGSMDVDRLTQFARELLETSSEYGSKKFLLDYREANSQQLSTLEICDLPDILAGLGLTQEHKVAMVFSAQTDRRDDFPFYDKLANLSRLTNGIFTDIESAQAWLEAP